MCITLCNKHLLLFTYNLNVVDVKKKIMTLELLF